MRRHELPRRAHDLLEWLWRRAGERPGQLHLHSRAALHGLFLHWLIERSDVELAEIPSVASIDRGLVDLVKAGLVRQQLDAAGSLWLDCLPTICRVAEVPQQYLFDEPVEATSSPAIFSPPNDVSAQVQTLSPSPVAAEQAPPRPTISQPISRPQPASDSPRKARPIATETEAVKALQSLVSRRQEAALAQEVRNVKRLEVSIDTKERLTFNPPAVENVSTAPKPTPAPNLQIGPSNASGREVAQSPTAGKGAAVQALAEAMRAKLRGRGIYPWMCLLAAWNVHACSGSHVSEAVLWGLVASDLQSARKPGNVFRGRLRAVLEQYDGRWLSLREFPAELEKLGLRWDPLWTRANE